MKHLIIFATILTLFSCGQKNESPEVSPKQNFALSSSPVDAKLANTYYILENKDSMFFRSTTVSKSVLITYDSLFTELRKYVAPVVTPPVVVPSGVPVPTAVPSMKGIPLSKWPVIAGNVKESTLGGRSCLVFNVTPSDPEIAFGKRSEVNLYSQQNKEPFEVSFLISYYVPSSNLIELAALTDVITQFHDPRDDAKWKSPFDFNVSADTWLVQYRNDNNLDGIPIKLGKVSKDVWTDFYFHLKFSGKGNGLIEIWKDGTQVYSSAVSMGYSGNQTAPFFKMGAYCWFWNKNNSTQWSYVKSKTRTYGMDLKGLWYY